MGIEEVTSLSQPGGSENAGPTDGTSAEVLAGDVHAGDRVILSEVASGADAGAKRPGPPAPLRGFRLGG